MNTKRVSAFIVASVVTVACMSSCSLPESEVALNAKQVANAGKPLQPGVRYEVRKALAAGIPFRPSEMKRHYFVFEAPRPPLMFASLQPGRHMTVRTTAYCHDEDDHIVYGTQNAVGSTLKFGNIRSAAADWSRYPVGTLFRIANQPDVIYEVDDYGSALVGTGTIDIYKPSRSQMNDWGVRHVDIEVVKWGSYQRSMAIMKDRMRWPHVRRMVEDIQSRAIQATSRSLKTSVTAPL